MTSLLLGLALSTPQTAVAHPPRPVVVQAAYARPVIVAPRRAVTVEEFVRCFRPTAGTHHVWVIHPVTCRPVEVCFTLPPGCPRVRIHQREVEFDYGRREVEIQFRRNGTVRVEY